MIWRLKFLILFQCTLIVEVYFVIFRNLYNISKDGELMKILLKFLIANLIIIYNLSLE